MKLVLSAVLAILTAGPAMAMQNIKLGTMDFNPFVSTEGRYDDNIYLSSSAKQFSWINKTAVGFTANQKLGSRFILNGGYTFEVISYSKQKDINNAVHHLANFGVESSLPRDTSLNVNDAFLATTDPATSELTARAKRVQNNATLVVESPLRGNFGFTLESRHIFNEYMSYDFHGLNRTEFNLGGGLTYKLMPKTKAFVDVVYGRLDYRDSNDWDADYTNVGGGVAGKLSQKITGTVKAFAQFRNYLHPLAGAADNVTTGGYSAQAVWADDKNTSVTLYASRSNIESTYVYSRYYTSTLTDIKLHHSINKFDLGLGFGYEAAAYPEPTPSRNEKRKDGYSNVRLNVDYNIQKWLKAGLGYAYKNRSSNEKEFEYDDNVVSLQLKGYF